MQSTEAGAAQSRPRSSLGAEADRSTEPPFFRPYDRKSRAKAGRGHRRREEPPNAADLHAEQRKAQEGPKKGPTEPKRRQPPHRRQPTGTEEATGAEQQSRTGAGSRQAARLCCVLCSVPAFATGQAEARREAAKSSRPPLLCPVGAEQQRKSRPKSRSSRTEAAKAGRAEAKHCCALLSSDFEALLLALVMQNINRMNRTNRTEVGRANYAFEPSGGAGAERIEANELRRANYARTSDGLQLGYSVIKRTNFIIWLKNWLFGRITPKRSEFPRLNRRAGRTNSVARGDAVRMSGITDTPQIIGA